MIKFTQPAYNHIRITQHLHTHNVPSHLNSYELKLPCFVRVIIGIIIQSSPNIFIFKLPHLRSEFTNLHPLTQVKSIYYLQPLNSTDLPRFSN